MWAVTRLQTDRKIKVDNTDRDKLRLEGDLSGGVSEKQSLSSRDPHDACSLYKLSMLQFPNIREEVRES